MIEFLTPSDQVIDVVAARDGELVSGPVLRDVARAWLRQGNEADTFEDAYASWTNAYTHSRRVADDVDVIAQLKPAGPALVAAGGFDEVQHPRDHKGKFAKKPGTGFKVGKKLKITHAFVHKNRPHGTVVAITDDGRSKVVFTGNTGTINGMSLGPYTHYHRLSTEHEWEKGNSFPKGKAYQWFKDSTDSGFNWHEPASGDDAEASDGGDGESTPSVTTTPAAKTGPTKKKFTKPSGVAGKPLKITHMLVHKGHGKPGDVLAVNGDGDKRVVWDGAQYQLQVKPPLEGQWLTEKKVKKSQAYVAINAYDDDWRTPGTDDIELDDVPDTSTKSNATQKSGPTKKPFEAPTPTPTPTPEPAESPSSPKTSQGPQLQSMDGLTKKKVFKTGAIFTSPGGKEWYVKAAQSERHARNQQLASNLYLFANVKAESTQLVKLDPTKLTPHGNTDIGVQTSYEPGDLSLIDAMKTNAKTQQQVRENFAIDAWLGNWDVVGLGYENLSVDKDGNVKRVNLGGSLLYRANGQPKGAAFGDTVSEIDTLRNHFTNPAAAKIFADVTDDDIRKGVATIEGMSPKLIDYIVDQTGFTGAEATKLKNVLKARRQDLINKYGSNAPKPTTAPNIPAASTQPTATNALGGTVKTYTAVQKAKVKGIFAKHNLKWHNKTDAIYDAAHEVSTSHPDLTMADALDIMDQSLQKKTGNPFRTKVEKWLKTKAGKSHALAKGSSASLGSTASKVAPAPSAPVTPTQNPNLPIDQGGVLKPNLTRVSAGILQQRMDKASPPPWTGAQRTALRKYTGGSYTTINQCARATTPCDPTTKKTLDNINAAMKPSTDDVVLYRKTNPKSFGLESPADLLDMVGKTIKDDGVVSTSISQGVWHGAIHLEIDAPKGSLMAWVQPISQHPSEDEMVVAPGTHYEIISATKDPYYNTYKVKVRIIPGSDTKSQQERESAALKKQIADLQAAKAAK